MKYLFVLLCCFFVGQAAFAQSQAPAPVREATNKPQDPVLGPKEYELKYFSTRLDRLQQAYDQKNAGLVSAYHSAILTSMRKAIEVRTLQPGTLPDAAGDLEKMQRIFAAFEAFIGFDVATPDEGAAKLVLLEKFQQVLQNQYDALKVQVTEMRKN